MMTGIARIRSFLGVLVLGLALAVAGCASNDEPEYVERPAEDLYTEASNALQSGNNREAARLFEEVERQHPYSGLATQSQLMAAFAYYEGLQYDEAILALDRFIDLHPGHEDIDYAYYLRGLSYYERISDVKRDQSMTDDAMQNLQQVVERFPDSRYARDARLKIDLTRDHLAGKEMDIGRFYMSRGHYNAAIGRFRTVVEDYQVTTHVPEALHRLTEAYLALGIEDEARAAAAVLGHNYPGSSWYEDSYALIGDPGYEPTYVEFEGGTWLSRVWNRLF